MNPDISLSYMFGILEDNAADLDIIDYSLSQTTLEQVSFKCFYMLECKGLMVFLSAVIEICCFVIDIEQTSAYISKMSRRVLFKSFPQFLYVSY